VHIPATQIWSSHGLVFSPDSTSPWSRTHAQVPTICHLDGEDALVVYASRDEANRSRIGGLRMSCASHAVSAAFTEPLLDLGRLGAFDDAGVMPASLVRTDAGLYLYYIGWNRCVDVPYRNAIGLAVSHDEGQTFNRISEGPIMDRNRFEPFFCGTSCVRKLGDRWINWYLSCTGWTLIDGKAEARYDIKKATSVNGIDWDQRGNVAIACRDASEAIASASVHILEGTYHMWYCFRSTRDYRDGGAGAYRVGYARSDDGEHWQRNDDAVALHDANDPAETEAAYPAVYEWQGSLYMLYNGRSFGRDGFKIAQLALTDD